MRPRGATHRRLQEDEGKARAEEILEEEEEKKRQMSMIIIPKENKGGRRGVKVGIIDKSIG